MFTGALAGPGLGLSLIIAISALNALVLWQGIRPQHVLLIVTVCAVSHAMLIEVGPLPKSWTVTQTRDDPTAGGTRSNGDYFTAPLVTPLTEGDAPKPPLQLPNPPNNDLGIVTVGE